MEKYKIIMTGGGTAGHVTPNLALVPELMKQNFDIKYIGSKDGIEKDIIKNSSNMEYFGISSGKLRRYFDVKNFSDPFKVVKGMVEAYKIITKEKPDIVFSKGGFVTVPVVIAASIKKIPVVSHESDITPGLANKLVAPFCNKLCVTFPESLKYIKDSKGVYTGTPIRKELFEGSAVKGKKLCGFNDNKPVLFVIGGSLGSKVINETIRNSLKELVGKYNIIHICGKGNFDSSCKDIKGYVQFEYVSEELPHLMNAADYIISRAGANVIFEILALRKPNILIPLSAKVSRGDQVLNAKSFKENGYSLVIEDEELTREKLLEQLEILKNDRNKYISNMRNSKGKDGISNIVSVIMNSVKVKK
ncbi:undecaprenyldiphospho-muramoylpentapeptide beta-N-acetylglucosaminyltransferase [Clostridium folliculivorans]|uniref:UDP-N-acetylglucosamine--N-acetylmuramyl-(pentapeptide) pyrophosphoryl-undecaprenol N-acetylglucosamine transferase n=1 Tax=Clostridium folliculivorans TaxID=2886038 RepID=A0A9W6D8A5_9CLOT|nr:undecaprenyldiphospho-muramoylpentapeptide beta-N-acetylglucosaminyltransferase [Clostridium folliculivorans]GKU23535.1 UDP-N-acetylglucosamine--N-acetylmuramyl-(pentapeptide) pyrophosphoryl-undecaprenol N-acetylglucosamine transferase [Clostridium folliculivorans]GKU29651.1 UDP-N-acetylglucosamine--N-acetylmuramyl-(pentapeptide) pyrophosphoryl-undecaprenol N-acetylglucosamine transferase [Clostridium folliculivorans]